MRITLTFYTATDDMWGFADYWRDSGKDKSAIRELINEDANEFVADCFITVDDDETE
jgi:hypothetical protein